MLQLRKPTLNSQLTQLIGIKEVVRILAFAHENLGSYSILVIKFSM